MLSYRAVPTPPPNAAQIEKRGHWCDLNSLTDPKGCSSPFVPPSQFLQGQKGTVPSVHAVYPGGPPHPPSEGTQDLGVLAPSPAGTGREAGPPSALGLRCLLGSPGPAAGPSLRTALGAGRREGQVPGGAHGGCAPSPATSRQTRPGTSSPCPRSRSPRSPSSGCGCSSARPRSLEPPNGGQGWRMTGGGTPGVKGSPAPRAGKEAEEGAQGPRESAWGASGARGARGGCGGAGLTYLPSAPPLPVT